jgi:hypothetical protein
MGGLEVAAAGEKFRVACFGAQGPFLERVPGPPKAFIQVKNSVLKRFGFVFFTPNRGNTTGKGLTEISQIFQRVRS